jgi:phosphoglycolate phosphatase
VNGVATESSIKNVILDVDGTLLDSKRDIAGAQHWVLVQLGVTTYRVEDLYRTIGRKLEDTFRDLLPPELHHRIPEAATMYRDYYRPRALQTTVLFPAVRATLEELRSRGKNLAVATTKSTFTTHRILSHFRLDQFFVQMQGTDGVPYKPDPFIVHKILADQAWRAADTLMVGDAREDMEAGKAAGVRTCGVTYGALQRPDLEKLSPDFLIDHFVDLLRIAL